MLIGIAKIDITPPVGTVALAGFALRQGMNEGKYQDIEAAAMALEDSGNLFIVVSAEILFFDRSFCDEVKAEIHHETGLNPDQIWLGATHTHCGPQLLKSMPFFGPVNEAYYRDFINKIVLLVNQAISDLEEAKLYFTRTSCDIGINRRRPTKDGKVDWAPYPEGKVDRTVDILFCKRKDASAKAILYSFGCHPTTFGGLLAGGDYVGFARRFIEQATHSQAVLFIQGAGGDVKPNLTDDYNFKHGTLEDAKVFGAKLANSVLAAIRANSAMEIKAPLNWRLDNVRLPFDQSKILSIEEIKSKVISNFDYSEIDKIGRDEPTIYAQKKKQAEFIAQKTESDWAEWMLKIMAEKGFVPDFVEFEIHTVKFESLIMVALAGEICANVGLKVRNALKNQNLWLAGYSNGVAGYIASSEDYPLEGYEVDGFYQYYKYPGPFVADIDKRIIEKISKYQGKI